jgi:hypothetical protein
VTPDDEEGRNPARLMYATLASLCFWVGLIGLIAWTCNR